MNFHAVNVAIQTIRVLQIKANKDRNITCWLAVNVFRVTTFLELSGNESLLGARRCFHRLNFPVKLIRVCRGSIIVAGVDSSRVRPDSKTAKLSIWLMVVEVKLGQSWAPRELSASPLRIEFLSVSCSVCSAGFGSRQELTVCLIQGNGALEKWSFCLVIFSIDSSYQLPRHQA